MASGAQESFQPQSQAISRAGEPDSRMPSAMRRSTWAITSAAGRAPHRGHCLPVPCDQQLVRFSEAVIVKKPPRLGTARQMLATESFRNDWTWGLLVQRAA